MHETDRYRPVSRTLLSDNWGTLTRHEYDYRRSDGTWQRQVREAYDRGHGAACLLHDPARDTVLLVRQFRLPVRLNGGAGDLIEVPAGLVDREDPAGTMRRELEEETGYRISVLEPLGTIFTSPGSVTETLALFTGTYGEDDRAAGGGGDATEGEDIEVLHVPLGEALAMIGDGRIADAKTILLVQHLVLRRAGLLPG